MNQLAASMGVQMLLDLVAERITASHWARMEFDGEGRMAVGYPAIQQPSDGAACILCNKAGLGNDGLGF